MTRSGRAPRSAKERTRDRRDALDILDSRTPTAYGQNDGTNHGVESGWMAPFRLRLGLNYRY